ncbi:hypothetical protein AMD27_12655 [Acinetobacter sp. TGL-Y2]|uniref:hypothetical protein n=1 Tax=Acinetobacter sp. TGL-Y2 TaxID=1407071 RepID=UPI0007A64FBF|nr:hypothetical protein [Acinetobacter sp. TGL-Y2]AMW79655.1 hypothetical protein AMD27_12655 [Acinetobacter sp. TGL-Y2]
MAVPVILGIIKIAGYAIAAYELYHVGMNIYTEVEAYKNNIKKAKDEMKKMMKSLDLEISDNIDKRTELAQLNAITGSDKQSPVTKNPSGRGASVAGIPVAIMQKIPFRPVISKVCETADQLPMVQLRAKKGQKFKDAIPKSKVTIVAKLLSMTVEEFTDASIEEFTIVRLKQLAVNFMIECMDELLTWRGPLKVEVCFPFNARMNQFQNPPMDGTTRLKRSGSDINPFWPMPSRARGTISADIAIPEYRAEALSLTNIFALVEIKFQGDRIQEEQFNKYRQLNVQCKSAKYLSGVTTSEGFKLSLFRYPEDKTPEGSNNEKPQAGSSNNRRGRN